MTRSRASISICNSIIVSTNIIIIIIIIMINIFISIIRIVPRIRAMTFAAPIIGLLRNNSILPTGTANTTASTTAIDVNLTDTVLMDTG